MSDSETTVQSTGSASPAVRANIDKLVGKVGNLSDQSYPVFDKSLYPGMSSTTQGGIQGLLNASNNGIYSKGVGGALDLTADVAQGNRFGENAPGYATVRQNAIDDAQTAANRSFLSSGTYGSDKHRESLGRGISSTIAGLDYGNYQADIARQERAQANLPGLLQAGAAPSQMQLTAGGLMDADASAKLQAEQDLFLRKNRAPYEQLGQLSSILAGTAPSAGTTTTTTEPAPNPFLGLLGAGLAFL